MQGQVVTSMTSEETFQCVVKNTFIEMVESPKAKHPARIRSLSESDASLERGKTSSPSSDAEVEKYLSDVSDRPSFDMEKTAEPSSSLSTTPSSEEGINETGSSHDSTPREEFKGLMRPSLTGFDAQPVSREESWNSPNQRSWTSPSPSSWYNQTYEDQVEQPQVPSYAIEALHKLTDLVAAEQWKREDLASNQVTAQLYPFIPLNEEGEVTSLGSILHFDGVCKPCAFVKKDRCHKKDLCVYCHFDHDSSNSTSTPAASTTCRSPTSRKSKAKRMSVARQRRQQEPNSGYVRFSL